MPCDVHTIFYRGCGHVFLAQSESLAPDSPRKGTSKDHTATERPSQHSSPPGFPCNTYLPYTINMSLASCQECSALPAEFKLQRIGADPAEIEMFDSFSKKWVQEVERNAKMEDNLREFSLKNVKMKEDAEATEKGKEVEKVGEEEEGDVEDILGWDDEEDGGFDGVGTQ